MYVFKFGQTANLDDVGAVKKNGTHFVDNTDAPYNVGGATKGAGVVRLFAKGFKGARPLLAEPTAAGDGASDLRLAAAHDAGAGRYHLLSTNTSSGGVGLNLDLSAWGIQPGTTVTVEEVSGQKHGEVAHLAVVPEGGVLSLDQPGESVWLVTAPDGEPRERVVLGATDDAMVKAGSNANTNYGGSDNLWVKNEPTSAGARNVSYMKFDLGAIDAGAIDQAVLRVTGEDALSPNGVITHVYGIVDDAWDEDTITWNTAPNLAPSVGVVDGIEDNFVTDIGASAEIVGHLTSSGEESILQLDVTDFVRNHQDQLVTLIVAREVRFDGENVDDDLGSLRIASKERSGSTGPELVLFVNDAVLPGDFNADGRVDSADYATWRNSLGAPAGSLANDLDGGPIGAAQLATWRANFGASAGGSQPRQPVPEPARLTATAGLLLIASARCFGDSTRRPSHCLCGALPPRR